MHLFSVYSIGIPHFLEIQELSRYTDPTQVKECIPYSTITSGSGQKVKPLGGNIWGQKPVSTSLLPPPPILTRPYFSRTRVIPVYPPTWFHPRGITRYYKKNGNQKVKPMTFSICCCSKVGICTSFSVYSIGIPLFLENKSYPGIPTPRK